MSKIRVAIADDHNLFREGMRLLLSTMPGIELCLEATGGRDLLDQLDRLEVDVVLLDIEMKDMNGIEALKVLSERPTTKVIVLSMHAEPRLISYMLEKGAKAYLQKDAQKEELEKVILAVHEKGIYFNEQMAQSLLQTVRSKSKRPTLGIDLSTREREVLTLICQEYTTAEIGEKLFISDRTVEGHRKNLCIKLGVKNVAGLVKKAISLNLVDGL